MKALVFDRFGGPEVLELREIPDPILLADSVIVRMKAIGLNFADVYRRKGNYHLAGQPPYILGYEGAGVIEHIGPDVIGLKVGDRVAFADVPFANAELVAVSTDRIIPLPSDISFDQAASLLLQGLTAHYLTNDSYHVQAGDEVLVHAAAGGVGQLLVQLCKAKGARVLGLTSSPGKREKALQVGCDEVLLYDSDWPEMVHHWSKQGQGVDIAYDSIGSTLMDSFSSVMVKGIVVFYGMAGGEPPLIDPRMLMDTSKTLTGGDLWNHITTHQDRIERASALFAEIRQGNLHLEIPTKFSLAEGADAHRLLESRKSTGKILLLP
ncbi:quinone oxidoreductase [Paenibacillus albiflavus]|uniref:Quinone oxidoreductase n=1 Tax=Paenibacillus albiflavus TaxID=2545760 RepID=A0A4R4EKZ5_9BACL|nr:quinone oxidoreductase [Paenibacillus albiflavus]TCZ80183.1 quinone oxidoreductase [Paenibacillus albiflavus]